MYKVKRVGSIKYVPERGYAEMSLAVFVILFPNLRFMISPKLDINDKRYMVRVNPDIPLFEFGLAGDNWNWTMK